MNDLTIRQQPVVSRISILVDEAKAVASAILDNTIEDQAPLPLHSYGHLSAQLNEINSILRLATDGQH
jgi:hypothetical protein|tara:strand:+ start:497 stop:700 length:204 start_codon:yes stop_codon:yes gene_type:complete